MMRATTTVITVGSLAILMASSAKASDDRGLEAYLKAVETAQVSFEAACEDLRSAAPPDGRVWLRRGANGIEIAPGSAREAEAAAFWAEAALGAHQAAATLYGAAVADKMNATAVMIEARDSKVIVHDGARMAEGNPCDALRNLIRGFGPGGVTGNPFTAARDAASVSDPQRLALAIGGTATTALSTDVPANGRARGPDGIVTEIRTTTEGTELVATATADATPGSTEIRLYGADDPFRPVETIELTVVPGAASPVIAAPADLSIGSLFSGLLPLDGEQELRFDIKDEQSVRFSSDVSSDLSAVLETDGGIIIATDDDSGDGYGFALGATLPAGKYRLRLFHCCGGGGPFVVSTSNDVITK